MKKLLFSLLTMAFALASQAQITGHFMGLKMGFSSMEDAIDVFEVHGIQYEVEDNMSLAFSGRFMLEGYIATEGYMVFLNDQLAMLLVGIECDPYTQNCKTIKHALKNKYQYLQDDYLNLLLQEIQREEEDLTIWTKTDSKHTVFYMQEDENFAWGYVISTDHLLNTVLQTATDALEYLDALQNFY